MKKSKGLLASEILTDKQKYFKNTRGYTSSIQGLCTQRDKKGTEKQSKTSLEPIRSFPQKKGTQLVHWLLKH